MNAEHEALVDALQSWRGKLNAIGGYDNEMVGVPAGGVRSMVDEAEQAAAALVALSERFERLNGSYKVSEQKRKGII